MKNLNVYLTFAGTCKDALALYKEALGGEIVSLQTFGEAPTPNIPDDKKNNVMHAEFRAGDIYFMASDSMPEQPVILGNAVTLSISLDSLEEQESIFSKLSDGGAVTMPLQDTFWGARFGMLTDKFGINWMLNCDKK
ncbi:MAG: VOC family protein [Ignavibacteria bacterium]|nr:VOC family protein [Ignavibacteria bacterium]MBL7993566.1 VOC family protein [Candidatus Kapabacteria bacterium]